MTDWCRAAIPRLDLRAIRGCLAEAQERDGRQRLWWSARTSATFCGLRRTSGSGCGSRAFAGRHDGSEVRGLSAAREAREKAKARRIAKGATLGSNRRRAARAVGRTQHEPGDLFSEAASRHPSGQIRDVRLFSSSPDTKYLQPATGRSHVTEQTAPGPARMPRPSLSVGAVGHAPGARRGRSRPVVPSRCLYRKRGLRAPRHAWWRRVATGRCSPQRLWRGCLPDALVRAVRDAQRVRGMTQEGGVARQIGISRPQLANALQGPVRLEPGVRPPTSWNGWLPNPSMIPRRRQPSAVRRDRRLP